MQKRKIREMAQLAILIAVMIVLAFTPFGFHLRFGIIEMTVMVVPVAIGAILIGPISGAILGFVFGFLSLMDAIFGASLFGKFLLEISPVLTVITCIVPRVLCGFLSGWVFRALRKFDRTKIASFFVASLSTALFNTIFFIGIILLFFWHNDAFLAGMVANNIPIDNIGVFIVAFVGVNGVVEAAINFIVGGGVAKAVSRFVNRNEVEA